MILKKFKYVLAAFTGLVLSAGMFCAAMPQAAAEEASPEIEPLVWYEFEDAENMGKDTMGNFDLTSNIGHFIDSETSEEVTCLTQEEDTDGEICQ